MRGVAVRQSLLALGLLAIGACQPSPASTVLAPVDAPYGSLANDYVVDRAGDRPSDGTGVSRQALTVGDGPQGEQVLYINFDGATIKRIDPMTGDNSALNTSAIVDTIPVGSTIAFPAFDSSPYAPDFTDAAARTAIVDKVKEWYAGYNVYITTTRPASGRYTMILVGGTVGNFMTNPGQAVGIAPLDCDNARQINVGFSFAVSVMGAAPTNLQQRQSRLFAVAMTIAHEAGHTFGLEHVNNVNDIMTAAISLTVTGFLPMQNPVTEGTATCGGGTTEDTNARMLANLGPAPSGPVVPKPVLTLLAPKNGATVPRTFTISVDAVQPAGAGGTITKVEFQQAGATLAVASAPPYRHAFSSSTDGAIVLSAVAFNSLGGKASVQTEFTTQGTGTEPPLPCLSAANCDSTELCQGGTCVPGPVKPNCFPACAEGETCQDDGTCAPAPGADMAGPVVPTAPVGSVCTDSAACGPGGVCATTSGKQYCTVMCAPADANSCPSGFRCSAIGADHYCSPASSGCQASAWPGATSSFAPWLALVALAWVLRSRRRPSAT